MALTHNESLGRETSRGTMTIKGKLRKRSVGKKKRKVVLGHNGTFKKVTLEGTDGDPLYQEKHTTGNQENLLLARTSLIRGGSRKKRKEKYYPHKHIGKKLLAEKNRPLTRGKTGGGKNLNRSAFVV